MDADLSVMGVTAAFTCTDGLLINESPLFDPHEPFANRDPRLAETIVPFGSNHLSYEYNPHGGTDVYEL